MRLKGKRAIVTGGGGAIGRVTALRFAAEGAAVLVADLDGERARETAARIEQAGGKAVAAAVDVTVPESCAEMVERTERAFGGLDVMFNNAGVLLPEDSDAERTALETWHRTLAVNLTGVFLCCKYGIPALRRAGRGSVVNNSSLVALVGSANPQLAYVASKGGVLSMTRELAITHARQGIRFNAVCAGPVRTEMSAMFFDTEEKWRSRRRHMPMGRLCTPEELAEVVLFLASDDASFLTGVACPVDGGISAAYVIRDEEEPPA